MSFSKTVGMKRVIAAVIAFIVCTGCKGSGTVAPPSTEETQSPDELSLSCADGALLTVGSYRVENNTWGKGSLAGWSQCIGLGNGGGSAVSARFTWNWLDSGGNVKAYPEVIFGFKPSTSSTTVLLPKQVDSLEILSVRYDVTSSHTGTGNTAFDVWLTNTPEPNAFASPPITHEIMIWLESYGSLNPGGNFRERTSVGGTAYDMFVGENFGAGWRYIAFRRVEPSAQADTLDVLALILHTKQSGLLAGSEYVASVEFGNEVVSGTGDTKIYAFEITVD